MYKPETRHNISDRDDSFFQQLTSTSDSHTFLNVGRSHGMGLIPKLIQHCKDTKQTCTVVDIASKPLPDSPFQKWLDDWKPPPDTPRTFRFSQVLLQGEMGDPNMKEQILNAMRVHYIQSEPFTTVHYPLDGSS